MSVPYGFLKAKVRGLDESEIVENVELLDSLREDNSRLMKARVKQCSSFYKKQLEETYASEEDNDEEELDEVEQNKADEGLDVALQILEGVEERETEEFEKDK